MGLTAAIVGVIVSTVASVGTGVAALVDKPSAPAAPNAAQTQMEQAEAAQAAAQSQAQALQQRRGMASTILTSPLGVSGGTSTQKATLGA